MGVGSEMSEIGWLHSLVRVRTNQVIRLLSVGALRSRL